MMTEQTIVIHVQGFWRDDFRAEIKDVSGLYFVYEAAVEETGETGDLLNLVFIGEANNIRIPIMNDENRILWMSYIDPANELVYAYAPVNNCFRSRAWQAFVVSHKPPANTDADKPFRFEKTTLVTSGKAALLKPVTTVRKPFMVNQGRPFTLPHREIIPVRSVYLRSFGGHQIAIGY